MVITSQPLIMSDTVHLLEPVSSRKQEFLKDIYSADKKDGSDYLDEICAVVSRHCNLHIELKEGTQGSEYSFKVKPFKETSYKDELQLLDEWEQYYLPDHMYMEVLGVLENYPCNDPSGELLLMVCEDKRVFAYDQPWLQLVAKNLEVLFKQGLQFPDTTDTIYYRFERFKDMTDDKWTMITKFEKTTLKIKEDTEILKKRKTNWKKDSKGSKQINEQDKIKKDFLWPDLENDGASNFLLKVRRVVKIHNGTKIKLPMTGSLEGSSCDEGPCTFTVGPLKDKEMLEEWEQFYLPECLTMEVIGEISSPELVLMVCENGKVFGYEDCYLHEVAKSLKELFETGLQFPGRTEFYHGERFKDTTDEVWDKVKKSDKIKNKMTTHNTVVESKKNSLINKLNHFQQRLGPCKV